jgi:hypothetical protein
MLQLNATVGLPPRPSLAAPTRFLRKAQLLTCA